VVEKSMKNERAWGCGALAAAFLSAQSGTALPASTHAPAGAGTAASDERRVEQDLARSILSRLPTTPARGDACEPQTLDSLRAAVTAAIDQANPSRDVALAALALAHQQVLPGAACILVALDDTADELDGSGATVDDVGKVRGFVLYTGPLPPSALRHVSNP
jgi:hypothetical protein